MIPRADLTDLIAEIYDAALDVSAWARIPDVLVRAVDGDSAVFWDGDAVTGIDAVIAGIPQRAMELYRHHFNRINPWIEVAMGRGLDFQAALGTDLVPEVAFRETAFFCDFAKGFDTVHVVGGHIPIGRRRGFEVGVHRRRFARPFNSDHRATMQALFPHLQRALQIREKLGWIDATGLGFAALDKLAIGTVICNAAGSVLYANTAAEVLAVQSGGVVLGAAGDGIGARLVDETKQLALLIAAAARDEAGGGMRLSARDGGCLFALVAPLPRQFANEPGRALVMLRASETPPAIAATTLETIFGLTSAEAQVALGLLEGRSLTEISADRKVSPNTLRTQLAQLLRKTNTSGQRELVRVLGLLPPLL